MNLEDLLEGQQSVADLLDHHRRLNRQQLQNQVSQNSSIKSEEEKSDGLLKKKQKLRLQRDVMKMQGELEEEQALNKALRGILRGPVMSQPRLSLLLLPPEASLLIDKTLRFECLNKEMKHDFEVV
ncbi:hypothetical protein Bca52824_066729 [Brassica carinata]|uniref:Uncharacterized protein n=1 Tax=Brassica carinata TaxID=52824 RepID=A0A8X7UB65_BRACI|nr:hypothetical protein Bca52824_066729 [Brassica carinata]